MGQTMKDVDGVELIRRERERQVSKGWNPAHDDHHADGVLWMAAAALMSQGEDVHFEYAVKPEDSCWVDALLEKHAATPEDGAASDDSPLDRVRSLTVAGA